MTWKNISTNIAFCKEFCSAEVTAETTHEEIIDDLVGRIYGRTLFAHEHILFRICQPDARREHKPALIASLRQRQIAAHVKIDITLEHVSGFFFRNTDVCTSQTSHKIVFNVLYFFQLCTAAVAQNAPVRIKAGFFGVKIKKLVQVRKMRIVRQFPVDIHPDHTHKSRIC